jgi:hypothetical protein
MAGPPPYGRTGTQPPTLFLPLHPLPLSFDGQQEMLALLFHTGRFFAAAAAVQHCNIALFTWGIPGPLYEWRELSKASPEDPLSECCGGKECLLADGSAVAVLAGCLLGCSLFRIKSCFSARAALISSRSQAATATAVLAAGASAVLPDSRSGGYFRTGIVAKRLADRGARAQPVRGPLRGRASRAGLPVHR